MHDYFLSAAAKEDLIGIAQYGDERFGIAQSNRYRDQLAQRFAILANQPTLYPAVEHIRPGYRRCVCGAHSIYYRIEGETVHIMRVLRCQDTSEIVLRS